MEKKFLIRCRGVIVHDGKLLTVEHAGKEGMLALPGGHLEWGEDLKSGLERELVEELGILPVIGPLLYIHTFTQDTGVQTVEFLFRIENAAAYLDYETTSRSHAFELSSVAWVLPDDSRTVRPSAVLADFYAGRLGDGKLRYLVDGVEK